jgi:hypothetical protein
MDLLYLSWFSVWRKAFFLRFSVDKFVASGLMRREYDRVQLHLTLFKKDLGD